MSFCAVLLSVLPILSFSLSLLSLSANGIVRKTIKKLDLCELVVYNDIDAWYACRYADNG